MKKILQFFLAHAFTIFLFSNFFRIYAAIAQKSDGSALKAFLTGFLFDAAVIFYSFIPFAIVLLFLLVIGKPIKRAFSVLYFFDLVLVTFLILCEYIFFDEFHDRFNFIAVDYLIYTGEVLKNIWESYPVVPLLSVLFLVCGIGAFGFYKIFGELKQKIAMPIVFTFGAGFFFLCFIFFHFISERDLISHLNSHEQIVAKNGLHSLFAAYQNNEIDYDKFYTSIDTQEATKLVYERLKAGANVPHDSKEEISVVRTMESDFPEKHLNVVLVLMESMSARFLGVYGNDQGITPNLDRLAKNGLFFEKIYSTGTRTVRGIEATVLSIPPTPGQSIVRRPGGTGIFNVGTVFRSKNYTTSFIYGGYSVFDNMGAFFSGNGFETIDQSNFPKKEINFSNAWGVSDEDLFHQAIAKADLDYKQGKKFFQYILTTSNHRPFTYPEGKIDIPSHKNREGAVKYSDYAIGQFILEAQKKPWFNDTVFIFVADHNASVAGGTEILPSDFLIPMIFYSPTHIKPEKNSNFGSQLDLVPTLFGILNFSYSSRFFGLDLKKINPNRAFLGTYQMVSMMTQKALAILSPVQKIDIYDSSPRPKKMNQSQKKEITLQDDSLIFETVAFYKTASAWFTKGLLKEEQKPQKINVRRY